MAWTSVDTAKHRRRFGWLYGANYYPANAINQLAMWQADTFDPARIDLELSWAARAGMGLMRVYLHDLLHADNADGLRRRMDHYLTIAGRHGIATLFVFFDDCWREQSALGRQPDPLPFTHNSGWVQSPGNRVADDPAAWPRLEAYVTDVLRRFNGDDRIYGWDLYNEVGNGVTGDHGDNRPLRGERSLPLLRAVFDWARAAAPSQPLTACVWKRSPEFEAINSFLQAASDVVSYHNYGDEADFRDWMAWILSWADGRRVLCSEYLCRPNNTLPKMLPLMREAGVDAIQWGLVNGLSQTHFPWGWTPEKGEPAWWHHDLLLPDGSFKYPEEERFLNDFRGTWR